VLLGANGAGKTTFSDATYLGHTAPFPDIGRLATGGAG
jgi:ABC-type uncharacterized transport system ATPase subunit